LVSSLVLINFLVSYSRGWR